MAQKCVVARLNGNQTVYYDQDCEQDRACALCLIPKVKQYTLRGLNGKMAQNIDTKYYLSNEQLEDRDSIYYFGLKNSAINYKHETRKFQLRGMMSDGKSRLIINTTVGTQLSIFNASIDKERVEVRLTMVRQTMMAKHLPKKHKIIMHRNQCSFSV